MVELEKEAAQKKKDDVKLHVTQLNVRRLNRKAVAEVRAAYKVAQEVAEQKKATKVVETMQIVEATMVHVEGAR